MELKVTILFDATAVKSLGNPIVEEVGRSGLTQEAISKLNSQSEETYDELFILRVRNGRDFFISVSASYQISANDFIEISNDDVLAEPAEPDYLYKGSMLDNTKDFNEDIKTNHLFSTFDNFNDDGGNESGTAVSDKILNAAFATASIMKEKAVKAVSTRNSSDSVKADPSRSVGVTGGFKAAMHSIASFNIFDNQTSAATFADNVAPDSQLKPRRANKIDEDVDPSLT